MWNEALASYGGKWASDSNWAFVFSHGQRHLVATKVTALWFSSHCACAARLNDMGQNARKHRTVVVIDRTSLDVRASAVLIGVIDWLSAGGNGRLGRMKSARFYFLLGLLLRRWSRLFQGIMFGWVAAIFRSWVCCCRMFFLSGFGMSCKSAALLLSWNPIWLSSAWFDCVSCEQSPNRHHLIRSEVLAHAFIGTGFISTTFCWLFLSMKTNKTSYYSFPPWSLKKHGTVITVLLH